MSLYHTTVIDLVENKPIEIGEGSLLCAKFTLEETNDLILKMVKITPTQDFSVRCWISKKPGDSAVLVPNSATAFWHLTGTAAYAIRLHTNDDSVESSLPMFDMKLEAGEYYLNALNLINSKNTIYIDLGA